MNSSRHNKMVFKPHKIKNQNQIKIFLLPNKTISKLNLFNLNHNMMKISIPSNLSSNKK